MLFIFFIDPPPKKTAMSTTVPVEFHFYTDARVKLSSAMSNNYKEVDFTTLLRKPSSPVSKCRQMYMVGEGRKNQCLSD